MIRKINLSKSYGWSKGIQVTRQEDQPSANMAATPNLEESASHHFDQR